jgi:hypothetical protein
MPLPEKREGKLKKVMIPSEENVLGREGQRL